MCGTKGSFLKPNEVHHVLPFSEFPEEELNPENLETLCKHHHLLVAHLMSWKSHNINVREDAKMWYNKIQQRP